MLDFLLILGVGKQPRQQSETPSQKKIFFLRLYYWNNM
jgi:hypothetical protein